MQHVTETRLQIRDTNQISDNQSEIRKGIVYSTTAGMIFSFDDL